MRAGEKIRHPHWEPDEYLMGCYVRILFVNETFEDAKKRGMSIVKMKGENEHPDMCGHPELMGVKGDIDKSIGRINKLMLEGKIPAPCHNPKIHLYPQLNLLQIMSDDWEIYDKK